MNMQILAPFPDIRHQYKCSGTTMRANLGERRNVSILDTGVLSLCTAFLCTRSYTAASPPSRVFLKSLHSTTFNTSPGLVRAAVSM